MPSRPKRVSAVSYTEPSPTPSPSASPLGSDREEDEDELEEDEDGSGEDELESEDNEDANGLDQEDDAEGEEEDVEDQMDVDDDAEGEEEEIIPPQPVKIRFVVNQAQTPTQTPGSSSSLTRLTESGSGSAAGTGTGTGKTKRGAVGTVVRAKHARIESPPPKESQEDIYSDDELGSDGEGTRSTSPSKLTARQRAKGNKDLQETLVSLPEAGKSKALVLTEAERIQRREESARRRKRQTEQRLQDEQDQTINRLLRAQTSKSRSKLDAPADSTSNTDSPAPPPGPVEEQVEQKGKRRRDMGVDESMIRFVSRLNESGGLVQLVSVVEGREDWIAV